MPDFSWSSRSPLEKAIATRSHARSGTPGVSLAELRDFELVQIMARRGRWAEVAAASNACFGATPPGEPGIATAPRAVLVWSGPGQFLVLSNDGENNPSKLSPAFQGVASLSDQSSGRALIRVSGTKARAMLAKLSSVDLYDRVFAIGAAAATSIDHTGVNLWRGPDAVDGLPTFYLLIPASYADSICRALVDASAEYGVGLTAASYEC